MKLEAKIRDMVDSDLGLITQTWLRHNRNTVRWMPTQVYFDLYERMIHYALKNYKVICAVSPEMSDQIYGWACYDVPRSLLHFIFVKAKYRGAGIARGLLADMMKTTGRKLVPTNWTKSLHQLSAYTTDIRPDLFFRLRKD